MSIAETAPPAHYPTIGALRADFIVHVAGLALALAGGGLLFGLALNLDSPGALVAVAVYAIGVVLMLTFSMAYNFATPALRPTLRRLDHAGIFLMIAASYTPFTTQVLSGPWAWSMTIAVWAIAGFGAAAKLLLPGLDKRFWVVLYLALGWLVLVAIKPMINSISWVALMLLAIGGLVYSTGVIFYVSKKLTYYRAIWHGHVVAAAAVHYAAILIGVVLVSPR